VNLLARRAATILGATTLGLSLVAPAHAQVSSRTDASGDVTVSSCDSNGDNCTDAVDPALRMPDIRTSKATHGLNNVQLYATYADLSTTGTKIHMMRFVTNENIRRRFVVVTSGTQVTVKELYRDSDGREMACSGLTAKIDYTANTIALNVPRPCLSYPQTVRVGFGTMVPLNGGTTYRADDALVSGITRSTSDLVVGPELKRG
jgi:hypothetical protein